MYQINLKKFFTDIPFREITEYGEYNEKDAPSSLIILIIFFLLMRGENTVINQIIETMPDKKKVFMHVKPVYFEKLAFAAGLSGNKETVYLAEKLINKIIDVCKIMYGNKVIHHDRIKHNNILKDITFVSPIGRTGPTGWIGPEGAKGVLSIDHFDPFIRYLPTDEIINGTIAGLDRRLKLIVKIESPVIQNEIIEPLIKIGSSIHCNHINPYYKLLLWKIKFCYYCKQHTDCFCRFYAKLFVIKNLFLSTTDSAKILTNRLKSSDQGTKEIIKLILYHTEELPFKI